MPQTTFDDWIRVISKAIDVTKVSFKRETEYKSQDQYVLQCNDSKQYINTFHLIIIWNFTHIVYSN